MQYFSDFLVKNRKEKIERKRSEGIIGKGCDRISNLDLSNPIFFLEYDTRLTRLSPEMSDFITRRQKELETENETSQNIQGTIQGE